MRNICSIVNYKLDGLTVTANHSITVRPGLTVPKGTEGVIQVSSAGSRYVVKFDLLDPTSKKPVALSYFGKSSLSEAVALVKDERGKPR